MKRRWKAVAAALCAALLLTGIYAAAAGGEDDPLVTLSYLKNVFTGEISEMVSALVTDGQKQNQSDLDEAIKTWDEKVGQALQEVEQTPAAQEPAVFEALDVTEGMSLSVTAGCEIIVCSGAPVCSVSLIDQTDGTVLAAGESMKANHLYFASVDGTVSVPGSAVTGVVNAGPLNVRAGAGTGYDRLGTLNQGTQVVVLDSSISGWYMISGGGLSGYVSVEYITLDPVSGSGPASLLVRGDCAA